MPEIKKIVYELSTGKAIISTIHHEGKALDLNINGIEEKGDKKVLHPIKVHNTGNEQKGR